MGKRLEKEHVKMNCSSSSSCWLWRSPI